MLSRDTVPQIVADKVGFGETAQVVSPASLDLTGLVPMQGFAALTQNNIVFLEESGLSGVTARVYPRAQLVFQGVGYGITGKVWQFDHNGVAVKLGGIESVFEAALGKLYSTSPQIPQSQSMIPTPQQIAPDHLPLSTPQQQYSPPPARPSTPRTVPPPTGVINAGYAPGPIRTTGKSPALAALIMAAIVFATGIVAFLFLGVSKKSESSAEAVVQTDPIADIQPDEVEDPNAAPLIDAKGAKSNSVLLISASGSEIINIRKKESGKYKVWVDGTNYKGKIDAAEGKAKIKDDGTTDFIKVKAKDYGFKVTDGSDVTIVKAKLDGAGYKIKDDTKTLAKVKAKGDGYEVTDDAGALIGSTSADGKNVIVMDASGALLYTVRGSDAKTAAVLLALQDNALAQAGVLLYMNEF